MKSKVFTFSVFIILTCFQTLFAQNFIVKGVVTDTSDEPLAGANVREKGNKKNTAVTNAYGEYTIQVSDPQKSILVFSFLGMLPKEIAVKGQKELDVNLSEDAVMLNEVVSIGYGNMQKKDLIGAVYSITAKELENMSVATLSEALKGRVPGLVITSSDGALESSAQIRIRGGVSITQDNTPLFIVDGLRMDDALDKIRPGDVERIDVLRDAASTAIYGAEGANGVILITTKRGIKGRNTVTYDSYYTFKTLGEGVPLLNARDFVQYSYEQTGGSVKEWEDLYGKYADFEENWGNREGIDWQDVLYGGVGFSQMHKVGLSGGTDKTRYNMSYTFNKNANVIPDSWEKEHNLRVSLDHKIKNFSFRTDINYLHGKSKGSGAYQENGGQIKDLLKYAPTVGLYGDDQTMLTQNGYYEDIENDNSLVLNPYMDLMTRIREGEEDNISIGGSVNWNIWKGLTYNLTAGYERRFEEGRNFYTAESVSAQLGTGPSGSLRQDKRNYYRGNHTLSYAHSWGKDIDLNVMVGQELYKYVRERVEFGAGGFPDINLGLDNWEMATIAEIPESTKEGYQSMGFFGRAGFSFKKRYLLSATVRADGKSLFGGNNKWGYFPSAQAAWRISDEAFMQKQKVFSNLKLRFSYGVAGNARLNDDYSYMFAPDFYPVDGERMSALYPTNLNNPDLKWEKNISYNFGVDMGFLKNRISLILDAYITDTRDLLLDANIPYLNGFDKTLKNAGRTRNKGFELAINTLNISRRNFDWSTSLNMTLNRREILALAGTDRWEYYSNSGAQGGADYMIEVGGNTGKMWGYVNDGIYLPDDFDFIDGEWVLKEGIISNTLVTPQPGSRKYKDLDGNNEIDENDKTYIGDANPLLTGGILNTFRFKNFDFSFFCEFKIGGDIYNANLFTYLRAGKRGNTVQWVFDKRYRTVDEQGNFLLLTGDKEGLKRLNEGREIFPSNGFVPLDDTFIEDGSYLRFSNVTLGYSVPRHLLNRVRIQRLRFYFTANNLFVITGYSGFDPEVNMNRNNGMTPAVDRGSMPRGHSWIVGMNLTF